MRPIISLTLATLPLVLGLAGCGGKKAPEGPVVVEGWHQEDGWKAACYFPPDYKDSDRMTQNTVRNEMMTQWKGERGDGVSFSSGVITDVETVLLGKPDAVKGVARQNLDWCRKVMSGQASMDQWQTWFASLKSQLTAGDCKWPPLRYQQHEYLDVGKGWQFEGRVCKGDTIRIEVSSLDYYRLDDDMDWINADGTGERAVGDGYPCTLEECGVGMVIYRFTGDQSGTITYGAVGTETIFEAPEHGILHLRVNEADDSFFDNKWRKKGSLVDHAAIAYIGLDE
jgi:predicted small lipoprotein YifL